jgi:phenylalanyl-tRNA synthetase beta chain
MKVSVNWLKKYTDIDVSVDELVSKISTQIGAVESVVNLAESYKNIYVVKVVEAKKHPNADKLTVCLIDDGGVVGDVALRNDKGLVEVVCGAPNVEPGMLAIWLAPGSVVPSTVLDEKSEPWAVEPKELRGVTSYGMLASSAEMAISDNHSGIVKLADDAQVGQSIVEYLELDDTVIDIENKMFTHRPDCFGIIGVAREVTGVLNKSFKSPDWYLSNSKIDAESVSLVVNNEVPDLVPRFMVAKLENVEVSDTDLKQQSYLSRIGIRPINSLVDLTNKMMVLTGQPMHAYDADKLISVCGENGGKLGFGLRKSRLGDRIKLINGKTVAFEDNDSDILVTFNDVPVAIGGVMGGIDTEVDENTKTAILECATFDMYSIRRSSMKHGLFSDAVTRFNKGQSPFQNHRVLRQSIDILGQANASIKLTELVDDVHIDCEQKVVQTSADFIESRLGLGLEAQEIVERLNNVELEASLNQDGTLEVGVPFWRKDIQTKEDINEEILRLVGYDALKTELPKRSLKPTPTNELLDFQRRLRNILSSVGATEVLNYSFVSKKLLEKAEQDPLGCIDIVNALSHDLEYYRPNLTVSGMSKISQNLRKSYDEFALFEIGKVHIKGLMSEAELELPKEFQRLAYVYAADEKVFRSQYDGSVYYAALKSLQYLLHELAIDYRIENAPADLPRHFEQLIRAYDKDRTGYVIAEDKVLGVVGLPAHSAMKAFKLPDSTAMFELDVDLLLSLARSKKHYRPLSIYPEVKEDVSLQVDYSTSYRYISELISSELVKVTDFMVDFEPIDIYAPKDHSYKNFVFRFRAVSSKETLKSEDLSSVIEALLESLSKSLKISRV